MNKNFSVWIILLLSFLFQEGKTAVCSSECTQIFVGTTYSNSAACTSSNNCQVCDTNFYYLNAVSGDCVQSASSIYNVTSPVALNPISFTGTIDTTAVASGLSGCVDFNDAGTIVYTPAFPVAIEGYYAVRFRFLMMEDLSNSAPTLTFAVTGLYGQ